MDSVRFPLTVSCVAFVVCAFAALAAGAAGDASAPDPNSQAVAVVARIGDYAITRDELSQRLLQEFRPHEEEFPRPAPPVTAATVLRKMLAEKAAGMEGRRLGYLRDDQIHAAVVQFEQQRIVSRLLESQLGDKVTVDDAEIDQVMKANPKATREQAQMQAQRGKAVRLMEQYYAQLTAKRNLKKVAENLPKAAEIHQRLLLQPRQPRGAGEYWIRNSQLITDLSEEEKSLVLATFDGGQFTLKDWFQMLCNIAPPRRPRDLDKPQGVEKLLDMALRGPVLAVEAKSLGYDKDPKLQSDIRALEDQRLLYKMQEEKTKHIKEPAPEAVKAYFEKDPARFATSAVLKADQIWCPDEETARKIKGMLDQGSDFQAVKKDYSLQKDVSSYSLSPGMEGPFWNDLWKGEPNQVVGPVMGFYGSGAKWRLVKIQEKTPAQPQAFSEQLAGSIKWVLFGDQRQQALRDFEKEMLEKYPHEIYGAAIEDLDPLQIALRQQDK